MLIFKHAPNDKNLFTAEMPVGVEVSLWSPADQCGALTLSHQWHHRQARDHALQPLCRSGVNDFSVLLVSTEVSELHKENTTRVAMRRVDEPGGFIM